MYILISGLDIDVYLFYLEDNGHNKAEFVSQVGCHVGFGSLSSPLVADIDCN